MKVKIFGTLIIVIAVVFAVYSAIKTDEFSPAEDFPREALVYLQVADLPVFIGLWNESKLKENYLQSANFSEFSNGHLGLKLASRLKEFEESSGFSIDLQTVAALADKRAALAIYDIGKIEFVFIAPASEQLFAATKFVQNSANFEEQTLENGTTIYRANVKADRGRQRQELIFCRAKDRFILATSEKLLVQTLANVSNTKNKNSLADNPDFKNLAAKIEPHSATVWVNQIALNKDYYFKRYWLMSDAEALKKIRAGIFDIAVEEEKIVEHRKFLLTENTEIAPIHLSRAASLSVYLPEDVVFYRLEKANQKSVDTVVENTIFKRQIVDAKSSKQRTYGINYFDEDYYSRYSDYTDLGENFGENINENEDEKDVERKIEDFNFAEFFQNANPQAVLTFTQPRVLDAPLFVEFDRAAIFNLSAPNNFQRENFEAAISKKLLAQTSISASENFPSWRSNAENGINWRESELPLLGIKICYTIVGNELILTNNAEFLRKILKTAKNKAPEKSSESFTKLTVLNLDQKEKAFDEVFSALADEDSADDFFTGNVESLLSAISDIKQVKTTEKFSGNLLEQTVVGVKEKF